MVWSRKKLLPSMPCERTVQTVCRSSALPTKKVWELEEDEEQEEGDEVLFLGEFRPQGAVGLRNSGLTAKILASSWTLDTPHG